jgi:rod shape determining protein RodA
MTGSLLFPITLVSGLGIFTIWSINPDLVLGQLIALTIGYILFFLSGRLKAATLRNASIFLYIGLIVALLILFSQPAIRGAQRWLILPNNITIQIAEIGKPIYILSLAGLCSLFKPRNIRHLITFLILGSIPILLVLKQPDLGDAVLYFMVLLAILFSSYSKYRYILALVLAGIILLPLGWNSLEDYQKSRIISFTTPSYDPQGAGYNATQALIAVGSGKISGRGLGRGTQSHLRFLPESHTDFIFASLTEELGLIGGSILLLAYGALFYKILAVALKTDDLFSRLVAVGIFIQLFGQTFVNVGMNLGLVPITGVTLPLVSHGGSSLVATFVSLGLIQGLDKGKSRKEVLIR